MRIRLLFLALVALAVVGLGASGSIAAGKTANVPYIFRGELLATPPPGAPSLLVDVAGGIARFVCKGATAIPSGAAPLSFR